MAILDMQGMEPARNGHGNGSNVSLALCNSHASVTLCL
jgi:hypothetical protein